MKQIKATVKSCTFNVNVKTNKVTCVLNTPYKTFIGISKCHANDEFDLYKGKHLAESRAKLKYYKYLREKAVRAVKIDKRYFDFLMESYNSIDKFTYLIDTETTHIKDLLKNDSEDNK